MRNLVTHTCYAAQKPASVVLEPILNSSPPILCFLFWKVSLRLQGDDRVRRGSSSSRDKFPRIQTSPDSDLIDLSDVRSHRSYHHKSVPWIRAGKRWDKQKVCPRPLTQLLSQTRIYLVSVICRIEGTPSRGPGERSSTVERRASPNSNKKRFLLILADSLSTLSVVSYPCSISSPRRKLASTRKSAKDKAAVIGLYFKGFRIIRLPAYRNSHFVLLSLGCGIYSGTTVYAQEITGKQRKLNCFIIYAKPDAHGVCSIHSFTYHTITSVPRVRSGKRWVGENFANSSCYLPATEHGVTGVV